MPRRVTYLCACAVALCAALAGALPATTTEGRFDRALAPSRLGATAKANAAYNRRPLTVECWAKVHSKHGFNILVANQTKASATHWEIYTYARTGFFSAYLPGNTPAEVISRTDITDGKWHYVAMVLDGARIRLYIDGQKAADAPETIPAGAKGKPGPIAFGSLAEGTLGCDGMVDEVRISSVAREVDSTPDAPLECDEHTIGLWRFDEAEGARSFPDESPTQNAARIGAPAWQRMPAPGGRSLAVMPPEPDLGETRRLLSGALAELRAPSLAGAERTRDGVLREWEEQYFHVDNRVAGREKPPKGAVQQAYDRNALVFESDADPLGVVLRRTRVLLNHLRDAENAPDLSAEARDLNLLVRAAAATPVDNKPQRKGLFLAACALRRRIALANPLLDFDEILFVARGVRLGSRKTGPRTTGDAWGQHFATQYFGFNSIPGGGLFVLSNFKTQPEIRNVLENSVVARGRLKGRRLDNGAFLAPDLSYDGRTILFSWTGNREHDYVWTKDTTWSIFKVHVDGSDLVQLTDSQWDDFDACWLPDGRIAFISERRGGYIRCFYGLPVPQHVLHSMNADGSDVHPISYFETSEWHPSVNNDGMIVYTRWDYVDRENCLGSNFWMCAPDGRNPRAPHGNYPYPWHTFPDNKRGDSRIGRPYTEMNIRAIPGSHLYVATAAPHHGESFGAIVILDLRRPDDGFMSQVRRVTPYVRFPESEMPARSQYPYGTAWPLSEDYFLCNYWENLYLLDRFGNRVLLCESGLVFGETNYDMRLIDPIPLRPTRRPPAMPKLTDRNASGATVSIINVYESDLPFPEGTRIKWLRVAQNILKPNPDMGVPMIGYERENAPRIPLGIVPIEEDGSAYFEAPPGKELILQVLDENYMAVQSMRSTAYLQPGEHISCLGCHEHVHKAPPPGRTPLALRRAASRLAPEIGPVEPITYYRHVKPVFERTCLPCHRKGGGGPVDMRYEALEPYVFYFAGGMRGTTVRPVHGGSRSIPGRFGARNSRMGRALLNRTHRGKVPEGDYRRVVLWLDSNSLRLGAFYDEEAQTRGELVWPKLDVDPSNPLGIEYPRPARALDGSAGASD